MTIHSLHFWPVLPVLMIALLLPYPGRLQAHSPETDLPPLQDQSTRQPEEAILGAFTPGFTAVTLLASILFPRCCYCYLYRTNEYHKGFIVFLAYLTIIFLAIMTETILTTP